MSKRKAGTGVFDVVKAAKRRQLARRKSVAFVRAAGKRQWPQQGLYRIDAPEGDYWPSRRDHKSEHPAADAPNVYLAATDGFRAHVALVPPEIAAEAHGVGYLEAAAPDIQGVIEACEKTNPPAVMMDATFLREAIHPDAYSVTLTTNGTGPMEVFSFLEDGTQVGYALLMPHFSTAERQSIFRPRLPRRRPPPLPAGLRPVEEMWDEIERENENGADNREDSPIETDAQAGGVLS